MDDEYDDELEEFEDEDFEDDVEEWEDEDEDYDDYDEDDFDDDDENEDGDEFEEGRMDDGDVEWAGILDGEMDARNEFPMGFGPIYDDLSDEQKELYEFGYNSGYSHGKEEGF